jgi:hypothetical protein
VRQIIFFYLERVLTMLWSRIRTSPKRRVGLSHSARPPSKLALRLECLEDRTVPSFIPTTYTLTDTGPRDVVTADFRNLGTQDIAVANNGSSSVSVLLNHNDGTGTFAPAVSYPTLAAGHPLGMAAGDLNGDGFADIVVANYGAGGAAATKVSILFNNGDGTFQAPVNLDVGDGYVASVKLASMLGDGMLDIITANESSNPTGTVSVLLQDRNNPGTFLPAVTYPTGPADSSGSNSPQGLAVADFFGDGMASVAVGDAITSKVTVLRNDPANPGHLLPYTVVGTAPAGIFGGLAAGDLGTGGGHSGLSLVSASPGGGGNVSVFVNDGLGNFSAAVNYPAGPGALHVAIGQVGQASGNPYNDVVTANNFTTGPGTISILYGNGDGTLRSAVSVPSGGDGPAGVAIADFEGDFAGDGLNDIVVANQATNNVTVLLQTGQGGIPPRAAPPGSVWGTINGVYTAPIGTPVPADFSPVLTLPEVGSHGTTGLFDGAAPIDTVLSAADSLFGDPLLGGRLGWEVL